MSSATFLSALKMRRSIYAIGKNSPITDEKIVEIVKEAAVNTPSAFNSQSANMVVLFEKEHDALWDIVLETLREIVPENAFEATKIKIASFKNGHGTVLFFEDRRVVEGLQVQFPLYKENFDLWSLQSNGMVQHVVWTALANEGLGASLQHYNPLIDEKVKAHFGLDAKFSLMAQMPFGEKLVEAEAKESFPAEQRVKVFR